MELGIVIKNGLLALAVLGAAILSQQPIFTGNGKTFNYSNPLTANLKKASNWFGDTIYPKVDGGQAIQQATQYINNQVEKQRDNLQKNSLDATKKFLAKEALDILGVKAEDLAQCPN